MTVIALTGGIATGKSTVARQFATLGAALYDADRAVHTLLDKGGPAVAKVAAHFPGTEKNGAIDRRKLGEIVFRDPAKLRTLESILHPLVWQEEAKFLASARRRGARAAVLEIPLLFEVAKDKKADAIVVTTAPKFLKKRRAMQRIGMDEQKFERILARQMPDHQKKAKANFVIHTGLGRAHSFRQVKRAIAQLIGSSCEPKATQDI